MRIIRLDNKGWRARFDDGFDARNVSRVADAFGYIWAEVKPGATVYVGYDTRLLGYRLAVTCARVLANYGLRPIVSSTYCPTPALGWAVHWDADAVGGVMLTASSASGDFGGISARAADGGPVAQEFYDAATRIVSSSAVEGRGRYVTADLVGPYLEELKSLVDEDVIRAAGLSVVVDPMHGSGRGYLAGVLRQLGCRVHEVHGEALTDFGGLEPALVHPWVDQCAHAVRSFGCDLGIVLDGDADRMGVVDERGSYLTSHRTGPLIIGHLVKDKGAFGRIVATYSSSALVRRQAERLGLAFTAAPMGFTRIYREFADGDVLLGLEEMGGYCVPGHLPERDGLLAALLMVESRAASGKPVSSMVADLEEDLGNMTYVKKDIKLDPSLIQAFRNVLPGINPKEVCGMRPVSVGHADGLVLRFEDDSWVQLRPSRTEPLVRARAESKDPTLAESLGEQACQEALERLPGYPRSTTVEAWS